MDCRKCNGVFARELKKQLNKERKMIIKGHKASGLEKSGWKPGDGDVVLTNPNLGKVVHVAVCTDEGKPLYDQFLHAEPVGAVTLTTNLKGEIGIITVARPTAKPGTYDYPNFEHNLSNLGCESVEIPRGFPLKGEASAQTAKREGGEELGSPIKSVELLGNITPNTTFHPHRIPVYLAQVDENFTGPMPGDVNEKILKVTWVTKNKLLTMIKEKEIYCGMTLAAIMLAIVNNKF